MPRKPLLPLEQLSRTAYYMRLKRASNPDYDKQCRLRAKARRLNIDAVPPIDPSLPAVPPPLQLPLHQEYTYPADLLQDDDIHQMQQEMSGVNAIPLNRQHDIESKLVQQLSDDHVLESVCCACDRLFPTTMLCCHTIETMPFQQMQKMLKAPDHLPASLVQQYDASVTHPTLKGLLLSCRGVLVQDSGTNFLFCSECETDLRRNRIPKFAIANGLWVGWLPDLLFNHTTRTEFSMTSLAQSSVYISTVFSSGNRVLKSHSYMFRAKPEPPAAMLPRNIYESASYRVAIVGALTSEAKAAVARRFAVNGARVRDLLNFYRAHNQYYASVTIRNNGQPNDRDGTEFLHDVPVDQVPGLERRLSNIESRHNTPINEMPEENHFDTVTDESDAVLLEESVNLLRTGQATEEPDTESLPDIAMYRSSTILGDKDPKYWTHCFPELFPFGRGSLDEPRSRPISPKLFITHLLQLSHRRFQQHPTFLLVAFDVLSRWEGRSVILRRTRVDASLAERVYSVTRSQLADYMKYQNDHIAALRRNASLPARPANNANVMALENTIDIAMRSMWASNGERMVARRQVFSMASVLSHASAFWTLSPDTAGTYRIAQLSGNTNIPSGLNDFLEKMQQGTMLTRQQRAAVAGQNPYLCAQHFHRIVRLMIDVVLNYDQTHCRSRKEGGLFGHTEAFFGATEETNAKNLHLHMLIWFHGVPKTDADFRQLCADHNFKRRLVAFHDSIQSAQFPINIGPTCPLCQDGVLQEVQWTKSAYKRKRSTDKAPITSACNQCKHEFSTSDLLQAVIEQHSQRLPSFQRPYLTPEVIDFMNASWRPLPATTGPFANDLTSLQQTLSLMVYQEHRWNHVASCFKKSTHVPCNICRFLRPALREKVTRLKPNFEVELARWIGHEYLNPYVPLIMRTLKFNHDFKLLVMGCGPDKTFYTMKYTTKMQSTLNNLAIIQAIDKSDRRQLERDRWIHAQNPNQLPEDNIRKGQRRLLSMLATMSAPSEVGAPMAALYFINPSGAFYKSHNFVPVNLKNAINELTGTGTVDIVFPEVHDQTENNRLVDQQQLTSGESLSNDIMIGTAAPVNDNNAPAASHPYMDYRYRPAFLENLSFCDYTVQYMTVKKKPLNQNMTFKSNHPNVGTHSPVRRTGPPPLPFVYGPRLPDIDRPDLSAEQRTLYYQMILVLHRPHRNINDFLPPNTDTTWQIAFETWAKTPAADDYIRFNNEYYVGKRKANQRSLDETIAAILAANDGQPENDHQSWSEDDDLDNDSINDDDDDFHEVTNAEDLLEGLHVSRMMDTAVIDAMVNTQLVANHGVNCLPTLDQKEIVNPINNMEQYLASLNSTNVQQRHQETLLNSTESVHSRDQDQSANSDRVPFDQLNLDTKITVLRDALVDCETWTNHEISQTETSAARQTLRPTATLREISRHYRLDEQQHRMFIRAARSVLQTLAEQNSIPLTNIDTAHTGYSNSQFIGFLSGEAGMGKSEVLLALLTLNDTWQPGCVQTCALAGVAADRADGMTIHSLFKISVDSHRSAQRQAAANTVHTQDIVDFAPLKLVIVDEASTVGQDIYGQIDRRLRALKQQPTLLLGGVHFLMAGDWLQQGPVAKRKVYLDPDNNCDDNICNDNDTARLCNEGYQVYSNINFVVFLEKNWRHRGNPFWAQLLSRWRRGDFRQEDLDFVNRTCVRASSIDDDHDNADGNTSDSLPILPMNHLREPGYCPILVTCNIVRHQYNRLCTRLFLQKMLADMSQRRVEDYDQSPQRNEQPHPEHAVHSDSNSNQHDPPVTTNNAGNVLPQPFIHRFKPVLHQSTRGARLTAAEKSSMHNLQADSSNRVEMQLDLMVGMPVMCTQNFNACHALRLKNGTLGYVHSFQFHPDDQYQDLLDPHTNHLIRIHSKLPVAVFLRKFGNHHKALPDLPPGIVPLTPMIKQTLKFCLPNRQFTCQADFLPITCAFALTVDKCQGVTLKHCVISPLLCELRRGVNKSALYVATSRVTLPENLLFTQTLTMDPQLKSHPNYLWIPYFRPNEHDLLENNRLLLLARHHQYQQNRLEQEPVNEY